MTIASVPLRRKALIVAVAMLVLGGVSLLLFGRGSQQARADDNPNNITCAGHLGKGTPDAADPTSTTVAYLFACSGPISGYSVQPDHQVQDMGTEVFVYDGKDRTTIVPTDAFSCQGEIPGWGVNCVGTYGGAWRAAKGQFTIAEKLCAEPRVDALLTVAYAYKNASGALQTAIAGPFELGRPRGCPASRRSGKTRIPIEKEQAAS